VGSRFPDHAKSKRSRSSAISTERLKSLDSPLQPGLGERFTREIVTAIDALLPNPLIYRLRNRRWGA